MNKKVGRVTKSELQKQLLQANRRLESAGKVTRETLHRLVQDREDEIRAEVRGAARAAGAKWALLAVCDAGVLDSGLEAEIRRAVAGLGEHGGTQVLQLGGVQIWPPREG